MKVVGTSAATKLKCPICGNGFSSGNYTPRKHIYNLGTPMETVVYGPEYDLVEAHCLCGYHFAPPEKSELEKLREELEDLKRLVNKRVLEQQPTRDSLDVCYLRNEVENLRHLLICGLEKPQEDQSLSSTNIDFTHRS